MSRYERYLYLFFDLLLLNLAFTGSLLVRFGDLDKLAMAPYRHLLVAVNLLWVAVFALNAPHLENRRIQNKHILYHFGRSWVISVLLVLAFLTILKTSMFSRYFMLLCQGLFLLTGGLGRLLLSQVVKAYRNAGYNFKRIAVVGMDPLANSFVQEINDHAEYGYKVVGIFDLGEDDSEDGTVWKEVEPFLLHERVDELYISATRIDERVATLLKYCYLKGVKVKFVNELVDQLNRAQLNARIDHMGHTSLVTLMNDPIEIRAKMALKRSFDLAFAILFMVLIASWLFPILAIFIKLSSPGPVFFIQKRTGLDDRAFDCFKFRTMRVNMDSDSKQAEKNDPRITRIGSIMRKTNLDELPQFINVLRGEMSVVGPRPHMLSHTDHYSKLIEPYMERHWMKPGITGLAQSLGLRGETKELIQMVRRVEEDRKYIYNWSFFLDVKIVLITFWNSVTLQKSGF
jgi:putative colanic acid biosysnthesis UDP-glucose lipid carrier transferase